MLTLLIFTLFLPLSLSQVCLVNIDCDSSCINKFGDNVNDKLVKIFQESLYTYKDFDLAFKLESINYHPNIYLGDGLGPLSIKRYYVWYNNNYNNTDICMTILFTAMDNTNTLGYAFTNGKCTKYMMGLINSNNKLENMPIVLAHEIGHLLGLEHDCNTDATFENQCSALQGSECVPNNNPYIMYPILSPCSKNGRDLSPCSRQTLNNESFEITCLQNDTITPYLNYSAICPSEDTNNIYILIIFAVVISIFVFSSIIIIVKTAINENKNRMNGVYAV